jgi:hypothetical protein
MAIVTVLPRKHELTDLLRACRHFVDYAVVMHSKHKQPTKALHGMGIIRAIDNLLQRKEDLQKFMHFTPCAEEMPPYPVPPVKREGCDVIRYFYVRDSNGMEFLATWEGTFWGSYFGDKLQENQGYFITHWKYRLDDSEQDWLSA